MASEHAGNLWRFTSRARVDVPPLEGSHAADLVVIGGGFTGCAAALRAAELGASVVLLEAGEIGSGASGRNVGLVNAGLWLPPDDVEAALGKEAGARLNRLLGLAPDLVFSLIEKHGIDCESVRSGTLHLAPSEQGLRDLRMRHGQLRARGAPVTLLGAEDSAARTGTRSYRGALHDARAGTVQPLALGMGLARAAVAAGARLHALTPALKVSRGASGWSVTTSRGAISARRLLLATNAYHVACAGLSPPQSVPVHYFQLATEPLEPRHRAAILPGREGCWDTALVMSSFRTDAVGRLIVGGIGELGHAGSGVHRDWARRKLARLFPGLAGARFAYAWHGRIAMTRDHIPKILLLERDALACFGYSGRGIGPGVTFGSRAAEALLRDDHDLLPIAPVTEYEERRTRLRRTCVEAGATATHALAARL